MERGPDQVLPAPLARGSADRPPDADEITHVGRGRPLLPVDARPEGDAVPAAVRNGPQLHRTQRFEDCFTTQTSYAPGSSSHPWTTSACPRSGATTYWRVQALDGKAAEVNGVFSTTLEVHLQPRCGHPDQPASGRHRRRPDPALGRRPARRSSTIVLKDSPATTSAARTSTFSLSWTPTGTKRLDPPKGPFTWTVQAIDLAATRPCSPMYGAYRTFHLTGETPCRPPQPPDSPHTGAAGSRPATRFPELTWEPLDGAAYYKVHIGRTPATGEIFYRPSLSQDVPLQRGDRHRPGPADTGVLRLVGLRRSTHKVGRWATVPRWAPSGSPRTSRRCAVTRSRSTAPASTQGSSCDAVSTTLTSIDICTGVPTTPVLDWDPVPEASATT